MDREQLEKHTVELPYQKDEFIFRNDTAAEWLYILKEGAVKCVKSSPEGREVTLKVLMPGDLFCCEASALNGTLPGCAQAMESATVVKISRKALLNTLQHNPEIAIQIISYLGDRLSEAQNSAKGFALDSAERRLASLLVNLAKRAGIHESEGLRLNVRLTRQDFADMAGLTLETTSRIMSRFKKDNLIRGTAGRLIVSDITHLKTLANEISTM
ncbi:MAG: Crp/Fnr family transcriptional regulator [Nitrospirales bacterium]|nr:MAG: Crp/Fnr family transcriptional regulator [Nitrospirales bacterium]